MSLYQKLFHFINRHAFIKEVTRDIMFVYRRVGMFCIRRVKPIDPNKVVITSFEGSSYSDNPRYVSEKLHELAPDLHIVWLIRDNKMKSVKLPDYVRRANASRSSAMLELATARVWVDNMRKNRSYSLDTKRQIYFNTWHGDRGFKCVGRDNKRIDHFKPRLERLCDAMIAGSEFGARNYRSAFDFQGKVLMDGCPKNDLIVRNDPVVAAELRRRMGLPQDVRLLLYAPTYRDGMAYTDQHSDLDVPRTLDILEAKTGEKWMCLMRMHYRSHGIDIPADSKRIVDMTEWPEMAELLAVSDMLISDYSSCAGDFILRDKPTILFQSDVADYNENSRGFYFKMSESPFWIAHDMDELETRIMAITEADVIENCRQWREFFGVTETGHAAEASAKFILERMKNK